MPRTKPRKKENASEKAPAKGTAKHLSARALYDFLQVTTPESADFETAAHLAVCPKCARLARQLERAQAAVEAWSSQTARRAKAVRRRRPTASAR